MLSYADQALVDRDPALPGLPLLLDDDALGDWLSDRTDTPCHVRSRRIRYKPGIDCTLAFDLDVPGGSTIRRIPCLANTYSARTAVKLAKSTTGAPDGTVVAVATDIALVVTNLAGDRRLPALAKLQDRQGRQQLLRRLFPGQPPPTAGVLHTLRHNPGRRWVGTLDDGSLPRMVLRAYPRADLTPVVRAYAKLSHGSPRTPTLLGSSRRHAIAAVAWTEGDALTEDASERDGYTAAGRALALLHGRGDVRFKPEKSRVQRHAVRAAVTQIATLVPELRPVAADVAGRLMPRLREAVPETALLHGDFSADQVIRGTDGEVTLIDVDAARIGDPAVDLGCAAAALTQSCVDGDAARVLLAAMYDGYDSVRPLPAERRLAVLGSAQLLRKAAEPFRNREPDWAAQLQRMCELAAGRTGPVRIEGKR